MSLRRALAVGAALLLAGGGLWLLIGRAAGPPMPRVQLAGVQREEGCLACHAALVGVGAAHEGIGCSPCHLGDASAREAERAHAGLELLSGDLSTVDRTCGQGPCHPLETGRVRSSLMARAPGILAVDRFAFGEREAPYREQGDALSALNPQAEPKTMAESHVRKLCAGCHLGARKAGPGERDAEARGGGCTACHLAPPSAAAQASGRPLHPEVSSIVPERRCAGCHGRSGRIALSFRGLVELEPSDPRVSGHTSDGRPTAEIAGDVHAAAGMSCIDCHVERELMGSGVLHLHPHEAVELRCADCHSPPASPAQPDPDRQRVAEVLRRSWERRGLPPLSAAPLYTRLGTPLVRTDAAARTLLRAQDGRALAIPPAAAAPWHTLRGHERLSCQACHSAWAPRCKRCHTSFDPAGTDVDHLSGRLTPGHWTEVAGGNGFGPPLLAIGPRGTIEPFVEGMSLTLRVGSATVSRQLYAPLDPHTTARARSCGSCHPGSGEEPYPSAGELTRVGARLLSLEERAKIARVGQCLGCHQDYQDPIFLDFSRSLLRRTPRCR